MRIIRPGDMWKFPDSVPASSNYDEKYNIVEAATRLISNSVPLLGLRVRDKYITLLVRDSPYLSGLQYDEGGIPLLVTPLALNPADDRVWYVFLAQYL